MIVASLLFYILLARAAPAHAADDGLLLHWKFNEGHGDVAQDASSQGLNGQVTAGWGASPFGAAALLDATPATLVKTALPSAKRLGKASWTVMAWVKPQQFTHREKP